MAWFENDLYHIVIDSIIFLKITMIILWLFKIDNLKILRQKTLD